MHFTGDLTGSSGTFSGNISGGSINLGNGTFTVDSNGNMNASSGTFSGTIYCSSGTVGGWNIGTQDLSATSYFGSNYYSTRIIPGQIQFTNLSDSDDYIYINPNGLGFNDSLTYIGKHKGMVRQFTCQDLHFGTTNSATVTWDSTTTLTFGEPECTNVRFYNTPYITKYGSYLAREEWCRENFASISSLSNYLTKSDAKSSYLTKSDASKYTTNSEVRSIVRSMVKSKYLN